MISGRAALVSIILTGLTGPGMAQQSDIPPNLAGLWSFEAQVQEVCDFNGQARLIPTSDPSVFDCELTAEQICPAADVHFVVEQSCQVEIEDNVASVRSTIETFLVGEPTRNYLPDDFQLEIMNPSYLEGLLIGSRAFPAQWRRAEGAIS